MPYKVISPYTQRYSNESVHCSFKSLIPLLKITIHLDTQFPSDQTLNARTCLPYPLFTFYYYLGVEFLISSF